jgi:hypothetical protein
LAVTKEVTKINKMVSKLKDSLAINMLVKKIEFNSKEDIVTCFNDISRILNKNFFKMSIIDILKGIRKT